MFFFLNFRLQLNRRPQFVEHMLEEQEKVVSGRIEPKHWTLTIHGIDTGEINFKKKPFIYLSNFWDNYICPNLTSEIVGPIVGTNALKDVEKYFKIDPSKDELISEFTTANNLNPDKDFDLLLGKVATIIIYLFPVIFIHLKNPHENFLKNNPFENFVQSMAPHLANSDENKRYYELFITYTFQRIRLTWKRPEKPTVDADTPNPRPPDTPNPRPPDNPNDSEPPRSRYVLRPHQPPPPPDDSDEEELPDISSFITGAGETIFNTIKSLFSRKTKTDVIPVDSKKIMHYRNIIFLTSFLKKCIIPKNNLGKFATPVRNCDANILTVLDIFRSDFGFNLAFSQVEDIVRTFNITYVPKQFINFENFRLFLHEKKDSNFEICLINFHSQISIEDISKLCSKFEYSLKSILNEKSILNIKRKKCFKITPDKVRKINETEFQKIQLIGHNYLFFEKIINPFRAIPSKINLKIIPSLLPKFNDIINLKFNLFTLILCGSEVIKIDKRNELYEVYQVSSLSFPKFSKLFQFLYKKFNINAANSIKKIATKISKYPKIDRVHEFAEIIRKSTEVITKGVDFSKFSSKKFLLVRNFKDKVNPFVFDQKLLNVYELFALYSVSLNAIYIINSKKDTYVKITQYEIKCCTNAMFNLKDANLFLNVRNESAWFLFKKK